MRAQVVGVVRGVGLGANLGAGLLNFAGVAASGLGALAFAPTYFGFCSDGGIYIAGARAHTRWSWHSSAECFPRKRRRVPVAARAAVRRVRRGGWPGRRVRQLLWLVQFSDAHLH